MTDVVSGSPRRRYLALWFPFLAAERLRRLGLPTRSGGPDERPLVLVETVRGALRLVAVDPAALALGLAPGITLADARARVPDLAVAEADPAADARLLDRLGEDCDRWTMLVQLDPPDGITLDVTGCAHLFGGEAALRARASARLERSGLTLRATIAGTPEAARGLARFGRAAIVRPGDEAEAVSALPVAALGLGRETNAALRGAGLKTIGDLARRATTPLAARFGEDLTVRLRRILGREDVRLTPRRPAPDYAVEQRFAEPIARVADIEGTLAALAGQAAALLAAHGQGGRRFEAAFFRTDGQVRRIAVETGLPSRDPGAIVRLFRERLEALADPLDPGFGFDLIRLAVGRDEALGAVQVGLDGRGAAQEELAALVDRLVARFGRDRVLRFAARDTHDPDRAARLVPAGEGGGEVPWPEGLQVFDPPQPIDTLAEVPDGPPIRFRWRRALHEIARAEGPERIAPEWWRRPQAPSAWGATRDYYRVEDRDGRRFWVFRAGLYGGEAGDGEPRWFLHGLFP